VCNAAAVKPIATAKVRMAVKYERGLHSGKKR
jgi:hypothetical protein